MDFDSVKRVLTAFEEEGVRYVVFGAAALNMRDFEAFWRRQRDLGTDVPGPLPRGGRP